MIKIENVETYGWEAAIRGMRNPKNSWSKSDSFCNPEWNNCEKCADRERCAYIFEQDGEPFRAKVGPKDLDLMTRLSNAGTDHGKFLRMITVTLDITAPLYWWKEYDTYKVGTVANSCSTMHKIAAKEFTLDDFSHEHLCNDELELLKEIIFRLNTNRALFISKNDKQVDHYTVMSDECYAKYTKTLWWQMIQLLPSSYNQRRTVQLNYAVLRNMYHARKNHKLDCWVTFCNWIETLPYAKKLIVGGNA